MGASLKRLKRRADFLRVANSRRKWVSPGMIVQMRHRQKDEHPAGNGTDPEDIRVGFTVSRKVGNAVVRNRVRRRLKAVVERVMAEETLPGTDWVVIGRAGTASRRFDALVDDLRTSLDRLNRPAQNNRDAPQGRQAR